MVVWYWGPQCLKESYIKATGTGLSFSLQRLSFITSAESHWQLDKVFCTTFLHTRSDIVRIFFIQGVCTHTSLMVDSCVLDKWLFEESFLDAEVRLDLLALE